MPCRVMACHVCVSCHGVPCHVYRITCLPSSRVAEAKAETDFHAKAESACHGVSYNAACHGVPCHHLFSCVPCHAVSCFEACYSVACRALSCSLCFRVMPCLVLSLCGWSDACCAVLFCVRVACHQDTKPSLIYIYTYIRSSTMECYF